MSRPHRLGWSSIQLGVHLVVVVLLAVVVSHAPVATVAMAIVYAAGLLPAVRRSRALVLTWLALLVAAWVVVLALAPEGVYLAFPLFFLAAHVLPDRAAVAAVAVLTALAVVGYSLDRGWSFAAVIGPVLGALVAVATVLGLRAVDRESSRRGVLEERERLAREIHDTVTQGLASIQLLLGAAGEELAVDPARAGELITRARGVATANLEEARRFVRALAPAQLDHAPLDEALRRLATDDRAELEISGESRALPTAHDVALLRIAQEALANARRHAYADRTRVTLSYLPDGVALDVVDDGVGFDPTVRQSGFGLQSLRSRAEALGGHLAIESTPGQGTAIAVTLPEEGP